MKLLLLFLVSCFVSSCSYSTLDPIETDAEIKSLNACSDQNTAKNLPVGKHEIKFSDLPEGYYHYVSSEILINDTDSRPKTLHYTYGSAKNRSRTTIVTSFVKDDSLSDRKESSGGLEILCGKGFYQKGQYRYGPKGIYEIIVLPKKTDILASNYGIFINRGLIQPEFYMDGDRYRNIRDIYQFDDEYRVIKLDDQTFQVYSYSNNLWETHLLVTLSFSPL